MHKTFEQSLITLTMKHGGNSIMTSSCFDDIQMVNASFDSYINDSYYGKLDSNTKSVTMIHLLIALLLVSAANAGVLLDSMMENLDLASSSVASWSQLMDNMALYASDDNGNPVLLDTRQSYTETAEEAGLRAIDRVHFYLYTRDTISTPEMLKIGDVAGLAKSHIDLRKDTRFVTHGWLNSRKSEASTLVRDALLTHADCNVIVIDWSSYSIRPYSYARSAVVSVAKVAARMIDFLVSQGQNVKQINTIGHSFGAHVASLASYYARERVSVVVGLDPAFPLFLTSGRGEMLSVGDADYVLVIHSNGGMIGYPTSMGDADFYPNGGSLQNGCIIEPFGLCAHTRAYKYYAESINSDKFIGRKCASYNDFLANNCSPETAVMGGYNPDPAIRGNYYLDTNTKEPFAIGL